jgi:hypothetical protein
MACFDVESLYTNIPLQRGLEAMAHCLSQRPNGTLPSTNHTVELAEIVKHEKVLSQNNDMFIQQKGTAMGSKMAPNYSNLQVGLFEKNVKNFISSAIHSCVIPDSGNASLTTYFFNSLEQQRNFIDSPPSSIQAVNI